MEKTMLFLAEKEDTPPLLSESAPPEQKTPKSYVFYCFMTLSVMLLTLAFAATELFSVFFSDVYPDKMILSKLFGADAESGMSFEELMLNQSFGDLSFGKKPEALPDSEGIKPPKESAPPVENPPAPDTEPTVTEDTRPEETPEPEPEPSEPQKDIYAPPESVPTGMSAIVPMDLSLSSYGLDYIYNTSSCEPDMRSLAGYGLSTDPSGVYPAGAPLVLIVHTHATEGFSEQSFYDPTLEIARTSDKNKNVVHLGRMIADILNENGIVTIHADILHDEESYGGSYARSAETIKKYLEKYPTIRYVIDVHRDAVVKSSGELVRPIAQTDRGVAAQVMAVVGTGESLGGCPNYMSNLAIAQLLREKLNSVADNLSRPTCLRPSAYNQQYSVYSILLEIGAAGNTLSEAENAATYVGTALSEIIKGK